MDEVSGSSKELEAKPLELATDEGLSSSTAAPWRPRQLGFSPYAPVIGRDEKPQSLRVVVRRPVSDFSPFGYSHFSMLVLSIICKLDYVNASCYLF